MKRIMFLLVMVLGLTLSAAVAGAEEPDHGSGEPQHDSGDPHHDWSHPAYHNGNWHHSDVRVDVHMPFRWYDHHDRYRGVRIFDQGWVVRFPGLQAYKWHGEAFWYQGERITNSVLLYNKSDELVSVGFMHNGSFIFVRDDHEVYENHDSFFLSIKW